MKRIGIIDIGSNSIRLILVEIHRNCSFSVIDEVKETVRLGKDISPKGDLHPLRINKAISTLSFFKRLCISQSVTNIIAVATEAVRKASNQAEFLNQVKLKTDMDIRVLSGEEEAYFDYFGTINTMDISNSLLMDIGGSSTELIWIKDRKLKASISLPFGAINLTEKFLKTEPMDEKIEKELTKFLFSYYKNISWLKELKNITIVGIGGTIRNMAKINQKRSDYPIDTLHNYEMSSKDVDEIYEFVKKTDYDQRKKIKGLSKERADIFLGPITAVVSLQRFLTSDKLYISSSGLRDGLLYEYILQSNIPLKDVLDFSIRNYLFNYELNINHASQVWKLTEILYNNLKSLLNISENPYKILKTAALLHDCGIRISYYDHHEHSFYIILNSRINGLSHREKLMCAYIAASHRKSNFKINENQYGKLLNKTDIENIEKLSILLRISESLDRGINNNIDKIYCTILENEVIINVISKTDPILEINDALSSASAFEKIFNKKLIIK